MGHCFQRRVICHIENEKNIEFGKVSTMEIDTVETVLVMAHVSAQGSIENLNVNAMRDI